MTDGAVELGFAYRDGITRLSHLHQTDPLRVLFPTPSAGDPLQAVVVTTSGGLVGGDRLSVDVHLDPGAIAHVTASAAEKIYRSNGPTTVIRQALAVGETGVLEFLPPETILFNGARLLRETVIKLMPGAGFLGGDIVIFGRRARGERFINGFLREVWKVLRPGELIWGDALHLDGDVAEIIDNPGCFDGAAAFATMILAPGAQDPGSFLDNARNVQSASVKDGLRAGLTVVAGLVIARWLATDAALLRRAYAELACHFRREAIGLPPHLPRLWHV